ncbi:MAG: ABC transporter permease [Phycisphaerae bacterium]|nr:ABC transporter permease [Phycisphaerae bacterium]
METLWQDIRYGVRILARSPGFTAVVVLILAVGIGATTAVFSVVNAVLLRPLPYHDSRRIVVLWKQTPKGERRPFHPEYVHWRQQNPVFESMAAYSHARLYVTGIERSRELITTAVTSDLFPLLGVAPLLGRGFLPEEQQAGNDRVVILSHSFWKNELGGASQAIGTVLTLNGRSCTIVGIMPPGFECPFGNPAPFWVPLVLRQDETWRSGIPVAPVARLKKGVSLEQARAALAVVANRLKEADPKAGTDWTIGADRLGHRVVQGSSTLLLLLLGAAGLVLLITAGNVANLFLARATVRQPEIAMRMALGASRRHIWRQMLTESLLLSVFAGVLGLLTSFVTIQGLVRLCPAEIPRLKETGVDPSVLFFALGVSVLTGLSFSMMPAWKACTVGTGQVLKETRGHSGTGRGWRRFHGGLVVSQIGLSLILLIGAALLVRSLIALQRLDLGFEPRNVLAVQMQLPQAKYPTPEHCTAFFDELLRQVRALPHVRSAGLTFGDGLQLGEAEWDITISVPGQPPGRPEEMPRAKRSTVSAGFLETLGIRLLKGRPLTEKDTAYDAVLVDEKLARDFFPNTDPIGQKLIHDGNLVMTIVGVTGTTRDFQTLDPSEGMLYTRLERSYQTMILVARAEGDPMQLARAVRAQVASLEKDEIINKIEPLETMLSGMLAPRRFSMVLLSLFAGIALVVAMIGVYGLLQYATTQQTHDIGIRMALGARKVDVLRAVLRQGLRLTLIGVALGVAGALALTRVLSSLLYNVSPTDPWTLASVSLVLIGIALLASYLPARRAARIDPMVALRYE